MRGRIFVDEQLGLRSFKRRVFTLDWELDTSREDAHPVCLAHFLGEPHRNSASGKKKIRTHKRPQGKL